MKTSRIHLPESTLRILADAIAARVTFRSWHDGTSSDSTSTSNPYEHDCIFPVAFGSLLGLNYGDDNRSGDHDSAILNTSEFILMQSLPCANTYDTIYNPLKAILEAWRIASGAPRRRLSEWASRLMWDRFPEWRDFFDGLMSYAQDDEWGPVATIDDAETTIDGWRECGIADDVPAQDAGLMMLLWNLYVSDHAAAAVERT